MSIANKTRTAYRAVIGNSRTIMSAIESNKEWAWAKFQMDELNKAMEPLLSISAEGQAIVVRDLKDIRSEMSEAGFLMALDEFNKLAGPIGELSGFLRMLSRMHAVHRRLVVQSQHSRYIYRKITLLSKFRFARKSNYTFNGNTMC